MGRLGLKIVGAQPPIGFPGNSIMAQSPWGWGFCIIAISRSVADQNTSSWEIIKRTQQIWSINIAINTEQDIMPPNLQIMAYPK